MESCLLLMGCKERCWRNVERVLFEDIVYGNGWFRIPADEHDEMEHGGDISLSVMIAAQAWDPSSVTRAQVKG